MDWWPCQSFIFIKALVFSGSCIEAGSKVRAGRSDLFMCLCVAEEKTHLKRIQTDVTTKGGTEMKKKTSYSSHFFFFFAVNILQVFDIDCI